MAVRAPLYYDSGDLKEMDATMVANLVQFAVYQYALAPSVELSYTGSGGNLGTLTDTRLQAGAQATSTTAFPGENVTGEPSVVSVNYSRINQSTSSSTPSSDDGKSYPVYRDTSSNIVPMNLQDMKDTIFHPAIDSLVSGSTGTAQGGTYHISTTSSVSGSTLVNATPVFVDTRANTSAYSAGSIPEALDQPTTITNYYLQKIDATLPTWNEKPVQVRSDNDLQTFSDTDVGTLFQAWMKYIADQSADGYKIRYSYSTGTNRGSGMVDGRLNGSGNYQTRYVNTDDYRAQEFPNGTATTINTYYLKIGKS